MTEPIDEDRRRRDEAIRRIARAVGLWSIPVIAAGVLALALGLPWWIVAVGLGVFVFILLFEA